MTVSIQVWLHLLSSPSTVQSRRPTFAVPEDDCVHPGLAALAALPQLQPGYRPAAAPYAPPMPILPQSNPLARLPPGPPREPRSFIVPNSRIYPMGVKSEQPSSGPPDLTSLISQLHPQAMSAAADAAAASMAMGYAPAVVTGAGPAIPASAVAAYSAANNAAPESAAVPAIPASAVPADPASEAAAGIAPMAAADTQMEEARQAEMVADNGATGAEVPPEVAPEVRLVLVILIYLSTTHFQQGILQADLCKAS